MAEFKHKIGSLVRLHGLGNAAYNGRLGEVLDVSELDTAGRLTVFLLEEVRPPLLQQIKIKPEKNIYIVHFWDSTPFPGNWRPKKKSPNSPKPSNLQRKGLVKVKPKEYSRTFQRTFLRIQRSFF